MVNKQLDKFAGRVWHTGTQHSLLKKQFLGKNMLAVVPREIAKFISLEECDKYTFHSFRRTSATSAADAGSSTEQLVDFFGWKNGSMCQEYISSSKPAILGMASRLARLEALSQDPVVEVDVEMETEKEMEKDTEKETEVDIKPMVQEMDDLLRCKAQQRAHHLIAHYLINF